jgi:hypothetical protein
MKHIIFLFLLCSFFLPSIAYGAIDQRCFAKEQCIDYRTNTIGLSKKIAEEGFVINKDSIKACGNTDASGKPLGFCKPGQSAKTQITFFKDNSFENLGVFIEKMYTYGIWLAITVGVVMIVFAGLQYTASTGNPQMISSAKSRIFSALLGIMLAVFAYSILNTINPNLVNLRLPSVWLINQQGIAPTNCQVLTNSTKLSLAISRKDKEKLNGEVSKIDPLRSKSLVTGSTNFPLTKEKAMCGDDYFVDNTGGLTCKGNVCPKEQLCMAHISKNLDYAIVPNVRSELIQTCEDGTIGGRIFSSNFAQKLVERADSTPLSFITLFATDWWVWPWVTDEGSSSFIRFFGAEQGISLAVGCRNGDIYTLKTKYQINPANESNQDEELLIQEYAVILKETTFAKDGNVPYCDKDGGGVRGYALYVQMNDGPFPGDEIHFIGKDSFDLGNSHAFTALLQLGTQTYFDYLFTAKEIKTGGIRLDLDVNKIVDIDNDSEYVTLYSRYGYCPPGIEGLTCRYKTKPEKAKRASKK